MLHEASIRTLGTWLRDKTISSVELTTHFLKRIECLNPQLNAVLTTTEEAALDAAKAADARLKQGDPSPLLGIPMLHKDIFCTKGVRTTCGSKMLEHFIAPYDATLVTKLKEAGVVMLGKTNMDEFAMGSSNENSFFGNVANPWDLQRVPGGSSGGSSAAVAARLAAFATGTDTGGSIRQPASLTNTVGLKPTYGRVSRFGMIAFASSLDQAGPMTRTVEDAALVLEAMAGHDPRDSTSVVHPVDPYASLLNQDIQGLRMGWPEEFFDGQLDDTIYAVLMEARRVLEQKGVVFVPIKLPHVGLSVPVYYVVASAECSSNLSRYDGVRYGYRCKEPQDLLDLYFRSRSEGFGTEVKRRIMIGTYALSAGYYDAYYLKAQQVRQLIAQDFHQAFQEVDVIFAPTSPSTAFLHGTKSANPVEMYLQDIYTIAVNLAGLPSLALPAGFIQDLPIGFQLIGPHFSESRLLSAGHQYEQAVAYHQAYPRGIEGS